MGGDGGAYSSLSLFRVSPLVNVVVMLLITIGGIGYLTWDDVRENGFRLKRYRMQTKVILVTGAILVVVPAASGGRSSTRSPRSATPASTLWAATAARIRPSPCSA